MRTVVTRKRQPARAWPVILFIAVVIAAGFGLASTGNFRNPIGFLLQAQGRAGFADRAVPADTNGTDPASATGSGPSGSLNTAVRNTISAGSANASAARSGNFGSGGDGENATSVNWSQVGGVLFNLWYLGATAAALIILQKLGGAILRRVRGRGQPATV